MRHRTKHNLGDKRGVSLKHMKVFGCPHIQSSAQRTHFLLTTFFIVRKHRFSALPFWCHTIYR